MFAAAAAPRGAGALSGGAFDARGGARVSLGPADVGHGLMSFELKPEGNCCHCCAPSRPSTTRAGTPHRCSPAATRAGLPGTMALYGLETETIPYHGHPSPSLRPPPFRECPPPFRERHSSYGYGANMRGTDQLTSDLHTFATLHVVALVVALLAHRVAAAPPSGGWLAVVLADRGLRPT